MLPARRKRAAAPEVAGLRPESLIAGAAFVLSLSLALSSAWTYWRGATIVAAQPSRIVLYEDNGSLTLGVDTALVNTAGADFGDVITRITAEIGDGPHPPTFQHEVMLTPVFSEQAERQWGECPFDARCVRNGDFLSVETPGRTLDVPGGSSRSEYIGFVLQDVYCSESPECSGFGDSASTVDHLISRRIQTFTFHYLMHNDGPKSAVCRVKFWEPGAPDRGAWLSRRMKEHGWVALPCQP